MNVYLPGGRLPSTYQEVEYIESSRTQVINTGVYPTTQTYTAELEVESTQTGNEYWAFGIWGTTGFRAGQNSSGWDTSYGATYTPSTYALNTRTKITMSNSGKGTSSNTAIGLFGMGENGAYAANRKGAYKMYYCKIWNSGTLVRDFIPCYRKSDSVIGLYDLVNNQFYTNAGTGTFSKGNDVTMLEAKNIYIGGGWTPGSNTLAYYPFETDLKDYSGNGYDFTTYSGTTTFVDEMVQTDGVLRRGSLMSQLGNNFTISMYFLHAGDSCSLQDSDDMRYPTFIFGGKSDSISVDIWYNYNRYTTSYSLSPDNKIHHVVCTKENTTYKLYVDGELKSSNVYSYSLITDKAYFHLGNIGTSITKKFGNLILEKTVRTAQEVSNYYNQTKSNYGL